MSVFPAMTASLAAAILAMTSACSSSHSSSHGSSGSSTRPIAQTSCPLPTFGPGANYHPAIDAASFSPDVTNPWFPLKPGTTFVYAGTKDDEPAIDVFAPSTKTEVIDRVRTRAVNDRLYLNGILVERTTDYYAQDACGNVWYFGEDTAELDEKGRVTSREGSFRAGTKGAQPGVYMPADPAPGSSYRQEWSPDAAEDQFTAVALDAKETVPYGSFDHALRTQEKTDLEPGVLDTKLYARGVGQVLESSLSGPLERTVLVDVLT